MTDIRNIYPALERMQQIGMVLCVHGEVTDPEVDVFDREAVFIDRMLSRSSRDFPGAEDRARAYHHGGGRGFRSRQRPERRQRPSRRSISIINRNALFAGGLRPHAYCLPVAKREQHRLAVRKAATSGAPNIFLGTDSAPHARDAKESGCGCAGIFNAPFALESYASVFEEEGALDKFEAFASVNGAALLRPAAEQGHGHAGAG